MEWKTAVTDILGCRYPILQGAMERLADWRLAAAVANAGAHGIITGSISRTPEKLREDILTCKEATAGAPGTFGVNLSIGLCPDIEKMLEVCIDEKVPVETSVYKPDALAPMIKQGGIPWIHKAARVKDAVHAQELGPDAIILVGVEGAGIKNPDQLPTMTTIIWGRKQLTVPIIAAGGIGSARGFLAALGMGADGIMMGSAFMATRECRIADSMKEAITRLNPEDPDLRRRVLTPGPPRRPADPSAAETAPRETDWSQAVSLAAGVIDHVPTVKEFIDGIISEANEIINGWAFLKTR
ncbi:MAG: nitronate monooxygenase [Deltaproteobacteria bacterium]|nr:nitronate monooxygenase [Deltaproteobacteria bacterium]